MKDSEKVKHLRDTLGIPLLDAKALVNEYQDIETCETAFHQHNINVICRLTECDDATAEKYYNLFQFNIEKATKKILALPNILAINPKKSRADRIGYILYAENDDLDDFKTTLDKHIFIHADDFDTVLPVFESVFPLQSPIHQKEFSKRYDNNFSNEVMRDVVTKLVTLKTKDKQTEFFLRKLICWLNNKLRYAKCIVVDGTL